MRRCPNCQQSTIPSWHAHLGAWLTTPITCSNCHRVLVRDRSYYRDAVSMVPLAVVLIGVPYLWPDAGPLSFIFFVMAGAAMAGLCLWSKTIRYKLKTDED